ncbi:MAG TPA: NYN domain-containing protein [Planctomycetota bacterium]|nr:NYN domain-containing protein [Planctomycetota bacterium]
MILLIDGYNLLFSGLGQSKDIKTNQLETLRDKLVTQLKSYNIRKKHRVIAVFDGDKTNTHYPQEKESGGIRVAFSQGNATADEHIINLVASYIREKPQRRDLCVVTSDRALAGALISNHVKIISSEEFAAELTAKNSNASPDLKEDPIEKFTGLKPSDVPKWLKIFEE